jgi:hypothetical protein
LGTKTNPTTLIKNKTIMKPIILFFMFLFAGPTFAQTITKRPLKPSDVYRLQTLSSAHISPDGNWVAYTLSTVDSVKNKRNSDIWMVSWDGKESIQFTNSPESE